jgi:hypothetical protein
MSSGLNRRYRFTGCLCTGILPSRLQLRSVASDTPSRREASLTLRYFCNVCSNVTSSANLSKCRKSLQSLYYLGVLMPLALSAARSQERISFRRRRAPTNSARKLLLTRRFGFGIVRQN